jgi:hypothetical protein
MLCPMSYDPTRFGTIAQWFGGFATFLAVLVALFKDALLRWWRRPILTIDFKNLEDNNVPVQYKYQGKDVEEIVYRARLTNGGWDTAKNCRVFLTSIKEVINTNEVKTNYHDSKPLSWPGWKFEPRDIPHNIVFYIEVVGVFKHEAGWNFKINQREEIPRMRTFSGTYRFQLTATADNAKPKSCEIDVTYPNKEVSDWEQLRAR